jgi:hypothetical protein
MNSKLPMVFALVVGLLGGVLVGELMRSSPAEAPAPAEPNELQAARVAEEDRKREWEQQLIELKDELQVARGAASRVERAERDRDELSSRLDDLTDEFRALERERQALAAEVESLRADAIRWQEEVLGPDNLLVRFGKWGEIKEVRGADWEELGETIGTMSGLMKQLSDAMQKGEMAPAGVMSRIGDLNKVLVAHYTRVLGKLPTHAAVNGEFTHPINLVNMLAGHLKQAGMPLEEHQLRALSKLGDEYDRRWNAAQDGYSEHTLKLRKLVDEVELKEWFRVEMFKVTSPQQKAAAVPPEIEGLAGFDLYSPGLIVQMSLDLLMKPEDKTWQEAILERTRGHVVGEGAEGSDAFAGAAFVFQTWADDVAELTRPGGRTNMARVYTAEVIVAGKAQVKAYEQLYETWAPTDALKEGLKKAGSIVLPFAAPE